jgi:hypothetical protein
MLKRITSTRIQFASYLVRRHASTFQRQPFRLNKVQAALGISAISVLAVGLSFLLLHLLDRE